LPIAATLDLKRDNGGTLLTALGHPTYRRVVSDDNRGGDKKEKDEKGKMKRVKRASGADDLTTQKLEHQGKGISKRNDFKKRGRL